MATADRPQPAHTVIVARDGRFSSEDVRLLIEELARRPQGPPAMTQIWTA